jgi:nitrite reductase/ring-hydroxylating ferredoxin subunit
MAEQQTSSTGPDLTQGVVLSDFSNGQLVGHAGDEEVLLVQSGADIFAIGAHCTHYHGPLAEGIVADGGVRCPWHHACFDLRTGEAVRAPALSPAKAAPASLSQSAGPHRHCRRRRSRFRRGRNAAAARLWR